MSSNRSRRLRIALLLSIVVGLWVVGWATGLHERITVEEIRDVITHAGAWGVLLYAGLFCLGQIGQISGHPFIAASVFVWGWWEGALISIGAATLGAIVSFAFARTVGGEVKGTKSPLMRRILGRLDAAPIRTIALARLIFMTAPPLATALGLSGVRHREHALGTLIGLIPSVLVSACAWGVGLDWIGV